MYAEFTKKKGANSELVYCISITFYARSEYSFLKRMKGVFSMPKIGLKKFLWLCMINDQKSFYLDRINYTFFVILLKIKKI